MEECLWLQHPEQQLNSDKYPARSGRMLIPSYVPSEVEVLMSGFSNQVSDAD